MDAQAKLEERLVRYARVDTQSDSSSQTVPTTQNQLDLARLLVQELEGLGAEDVRLTEAGFVLATVPASGAPQAPSVAFLAHMDTASDYSASGVKPVVHVSGSTTNWAPLSSTARRDHAAALARLRSTSIGTTANWAHATTKRCMAYFPDRASI